MLQSLRLGPAHIVGSSVLPPFFSAVVQAAESGSDLVPSVEALTRRFGFDSFTYTTYVSLQPNDENQTFEFTTLPAVWAIRYDQRAYIEVDPRVISTMDSTVPVLWDQTMERARNPDVDAFLDDAMSIGIASGVCIPLHDEHGILSTVDFSSEIPVMKSHREDGIRRALGDMLMFSRYFNQLFKLATMERRVAARNAGMPLSPRETECLLLAANGIETEAIANCMAIDFRIVRGHFASIRSKLGVANSAEAIALVARRGTVGG